MTQHFVNQDDDTHHLVVIGIKDEARLRGVVSKLQELGIRHRSFHEPDLNNQLTAIATEPISEDAPVRRVLRRYQLLK